MSTYKTGDRVALKESALSLSYIVSRNWYTNMYTGKTGTILGYSITGKAAIQFDDIVFTDWMNQKSSHDNGCHGKGRKHYCWYVPNEHLEPIVDRRLLLL